MIENRDSMYRRFYHSLKRIRRVEETIADIYPSDDIKSPIHLSIGQEAVSVGVCEAMHASDVAFGTYRGHALYLAKGGDLPAMMAELYGKEKGCGKGKAGSMHLGDPQRGIMGTSAIVASTIPNAVGYAYAAKVKKNKIAVASFFGDGAVEEGVFFESINFASLKKLPILFVCENNQYAIHSHISARQPDENIIGRVRSFGIAAERVDGNDIMAIYETAKDMLDSMRSQQSGPCFMECATYRWREHVGPNEDHELGYRSKDDVLAWIDKDPLVQMGEKLEMNEKSAIDRAIETEIEDAVTFAQSCDFPGDNELYSDIWKKAE